MQSGEGQSGWNFSAGDRKQFSNYGRNNQQRRSGGGGGGQSHYRQANGNWPDAGPEGGQNGNCFNKFRDPQQQLNNHQPNKRGGRRTRNGSGGAGGGRRGHRGRDSNRRGGRNNSWHAKDQHVSPGESHMLYYDNVGDFTEDPPLPRSSPAPSSLRQESLPPVTFAADVTPPPVSAPDVPVTPEEATMPLINIKKEKELLEHKSKIKPFVKPEPKSNKKKVSSSRSSSSSEEESEPEPGEMVVKTKAVVASAPSTPKPKAVKPASSSDSSASDTDTDDKSKKAAMKKDTEADVVCMGSQERQFTITDEEESSELEDEDDKKARKQQNNSKTVHVCGICDKKGHTSFQCQMICRNCSGSYHGLKNCPNPPNLNIAIQSFVEYAMQQMTAYHCEQRFGFPAGTVAAPVALPVSAKPKKDKKTSIKKSKKTSQKRMKVEPKDLDEDDDDEDDEDASSESADSESSDEPQPAPVSKQKRKRGTKAAVSAAANLPPQVFPFPLLGAPGAPYNSMMYSYGAPFSFPK